MVVLQIQSPSHPQYGTLVRELVLFPWDLLSSVQPEIPTGVTKMIQLNRGGSDLPEEEQHSLLSEKYSHCSCLPMNSTQISENMTFHSYSCLSN